MERAIPVLKGIAVIFGWSLLFSWLSVYNTGNHPFGFRVVYWMVAIGTGSLAAIFVQPIVWDKWCAEQPVWVKVLVIAALVAVPVTLVLLLIEPIRTIVSIAITYLYVLVISIILTSVMAWRELHSAANKTEQTSSAFPEAFMSRLPAKYRTAQLYAVSSEDHYLRVHTSFGEEMILHRLSDAIRELSGQAGSQTHRSWWVAKDGIEASRKEDGKLVLVLKSGTEAPVSRTYRKAVESQLLG